MNEDFKSFSKFVCKTMEDKMNNNKTIENLKTSVEMWVWDDDKNNKIKRNVIHIRDNGSCVTRLGNTYNNYELIKEPTYRPYNENDDLSELLGVKVKDKEEPTYYIITGTDNNDVEITINNSWLEMDEVFRQYTHLDGTPLGVKE